jgi:uncharacterized damage-inducible protein DinB
VSGASGVAPFFKGWDLANAALVSALRGLSDEQLAILIRPDWPIWASASHVAGGRVYWLCSVFEEPGIEATPFANVDIASGGWEDDLTHPRHASELVDALESSWRIVERCLRTWTPEMLSGEARRTGLGGAVSIHTRQSVLMRMLTHDAFHCGEISLTLGSHGLGGNGPNGPIDMWAGLSRLAQ